MMIGEDEPMDPLVDPFGAIDNDPLKHYKRNGKYYDSSSSSDNDLSSYRIPASLTIIPSSSAGSLKVHKIPAHSNSITITKVDHNKLKSPYLHNNGYNHNSSSSYSNEERKRGRKKGTKNKFKKGIPIEVWKSDHFKNNGFDLTEKINDVLKSYSIENDLSMRLNSAKSEIYKVNNVKKKYKKKPKSNLLPQNGKPIPDLIPYLTVPSYLDPSLCLVVEIDPSEFFPDDPIPRDKKYRKKKIGTGDRIYECNICKKGFKCIKGVQTHKSVKHNIEDLSGYYPCEMCEEIFALKRDLVNHYESHRNSNSRYPCPENGCSATEVDLRSFVKHKKKHHPYLGTLGRTWFHTWGDR